MTITLEQVRAATKEIVEDAGPEKFARCFYSKEGMAATAALESPLFESIAEAETPICIAGTLVHKLVGVEGLRQLIENRTVSEQKGIFLGMGFSPDAVGYVEVLQEEQDADHSWELAHMEAEEYLAITGQL